MAYLNFMNAYLKTMSAIGNIAVKKQQHYENFPVASFALPKRLRYPISLIYHFARSADDFADEGNLTPEVRLAKLQAFRDELDLIHHQKETASPFFTELAQMIGQYKLPLAPFYDLLDAFSQDVTKTHYAHFEELLDYCRRSANPVGFLLLHLFKKATKENLAYSDNVCSALQLINFYQDIAIDFDDRFHKRRVYLCQDEMEKFNVNEAQIAVAHINKNWEAFMLFNIERAETMLKAGKPLGNVLPGRMGVEISMIIGGGEQIIRKLKKTKGDIYNKRPTLKPWDWPLILIKALL